MRIFKLLLKEIKTETEWDYEDKEAVKSGEVAYDFKGKVDEELIELKKGDIIYYQYGTKVKLDNEDLVLVSLSSIVCQK